MTDPTPEPPTLEKTLVDTWNGVGGTPEQTRKRRQELRRAWPELFVSLERWVRSIDPEGAPPSVLDTAAGVVGTPATPPRGRR